MIAQRGCNITKHMYRILGIYQGCKDLTVTIALCTLVFQVSLCDFSIHLSLSSIQSSALFSFRNQPVLKLIIQKIY